MKDTLDLVIVGGLALAIIFLVIMIFSLIQIFVKKQAIKRKQAEKPKDRKKRRRWNKELKRLEISKKRNVKWLIISLFISLVAGGGTGYTKYYQATNLTDEDTDNIVYGYYLLTQMEEQIKTLDKQSGKKKQNNIHELSLQMASFSAKKASDKGKKDAQVLLNRYYARTGQTGINLSAQNFDELKGSQEKKDEFLTDIKNVEVVQKEVLAYYKINESSLNTKK